MRKPAQIRLRYPVVGGVYVSILCRDRYIHFVGHRTVFFADQAGTGALLERGHKWGYCGTDYGDHGEDGYRRSRYGESSHWLAIARIGMVGDCDHGARSGYHGLLFALMTEEKCNDKNTLDHFSGFGFCGTDVRGSDAFVTARQSGNR